MQVKNVNIKLEELTLTLHSFSKCGYAPPRCRGLTSYLKTHVTPLGRNVGFRIKETLENVTWLKYTVLSIRILLNILTCFVFDS